MRKPILSATTAWLLLCLAFVVATHTALAQDCTSPLSDLNYTKYTIVEAAAYIETNSGPAELESTNAYFFLASVALKTNFSATSAQLIVPNSTPKPMRGDGDRNFSTGVAAGSFAEISNAYPGGSYQFIVSNSVTSLPFPSGADLPNAPALSDYDGAQKIDATKDYTLRWNPFVGGKAKDLIEITIDGNIGSFSSPEYGCPGQLKGTSTSIIIPANTLLPNTTYRLNFDFINILTIDTNSIPFVALLAGTETETESTIATAAPAGPVISNVGALSGGSIRFDVTLPTNGTYLLQSAANLTHPKWADILETNSPGIQFQFSFTNQLLGSQRYYRVIAQ